MMLDKRLYNDVPPDAQSRQEGNPTLLVSWWCTMFALVAILVRVGGRYIRTERLFREDKIMFWSIVPLMIRMGFVHVVLIWGTNNAKTDGLSQAAINQRITGSRLVLASRIFYALFIWTAKFTVLEFLKRIVGSHWTRTYDIGLKYIQYFLAATFGIVFIATLAECQPFHHYWQVVPDPGPKCREGLVQLIAMGTCDMVTDVILVIFPIPIVLTSSMQGKRKISLSLLFMFSLGLVGITAYRVPAVISRRGSQNFRTLLASLEILAAAAVANAIVIGSFIRDRGAKKAKYKLGSTGGSTLDRLNTRRTNTNLTLHHWGSDADLASDVGLGLEPELQSRKNSVPRPAPVATPISERRRSSLKPPTLGLLRLRKPSYDTSDSEEDLKYTTDEEAISPGTKPAGQLFSESLDTPRKMAFFDIGGLLDQTSTNVSSRRSSVAQSSLHAWNFASGGSARRSSTGDSVSALRSQPSSNSGRRSSRQLFAGDRTSQLSSHREEEDLIEIELDPISPATTTGPSRNDSAPNRRSGGANSSLIAALATGPSGLGPPADGSRPSRLSGASSRSRWSDPSDDLEIMDAGGLLR